MEPTREAAWETLNRYTKSEALLRHALAVEAAVGAYAQRFGEDEQLWRATALLHDFDYEIHPTLDKHPQDGAPILREEGYPEVLILAVLSHAEHLETEWPRQRRQRRRREPAQIVRGRQSRGIRIDPQHGRAAAIEKVLR